jgi:hypothetical protein
MLPGLRKLISPKRQKVSYDGWWVGPADLNIPAEFTCIKFALPHDPRYELLVDQKRNGAPAD